VLNNIFRRQMLQYIIKALVHRRRWSTRDLIVSPATFCYPNTILKERAVEEQGHPKPFVTAYTHGFRFQRVSITIPSDIKLFHGTLHTIPFHFETSSISSFSKYIHNNYFIKGYEIQCALVN
jgi:hypothetical protein